MEKISVLEAAKILGVAPTTLREGLFKGKFPFGTGFYKEGSTTRTFIIYPKKFKEFVEMEKN